MKDYYGILGISKNAMEREIKAGYSKMLRNYPAEKYPEKFKEYREAYEVLKDIEMRKAYDEKLKFGDREEELLKIADRASENNDFKKAILIYKEVLDLVGSSETIEYKLAIGLINEKQYEEAESILKELIKRNPRKVEYYRKIAELYYENGNLNLAEESYKKAYEISEDIMDCINLAVIYWNEEKKRKAVSYLEEIVKEKKYEAKEAYVMILKYYTIQNEENLFNKTLDELVNRIPINRYKEECDFLQEIALCMVSEGFNEEALKIIKKAVEIDSDNLNVKKMYDELKNRECVLAQYEKMLADCRILNELKEPIRYSLFRGMDEEEQGESISDIYSYMGRGEHESIRKSINFLKNNYNELYMLQEKFYEKILEEIEEKRELFKEILEVKNSNLIIQPIKVLIEGWIASNITEEKKIEIIKNLEKEDCNQIICSINYLKISYKNVYNLNSKYLEGLKSWAEENSKGLKLDESLMKNSQRVEKYNYENVNETIENKEVQEGGGCLANLAGGAIMLIIICIGISVILPLVPYVIGGGVLLLIIAGIVEKK